MMRGINKDFDFPYLLKRFDIKDLPYEKANNNYSLINFFKKYD